MLFWPMISKSHLHIRCLFTVMSSFVSIVFRDNQTLVRSWFVLKKQKKIEKQKGESLKSIRQKRILLWGTTENILWMLYNYRSSEKMGPSWSKKFWKIDILVILCVGTIGRVVRYYVTVTLLIWPIWCALSKSDYNFF